MIGNMKGHQVKKESSSQPLHMLIEDKLAEAIDEFRWDSRSTTRTKAIKAMLWLGYETHFKKDGKKK